MSVPSEFDVRAVPWTALTGAINLGGLGLLLWGVTSQAHLGLAGSHLAALLLVVVAVACWLTWALFRSTRVRRPAQLTVLVAMALSGGALVAFSPVALVFPAMAALSAAASWRSEIAVGVGAAGWVAASVSVLAVGRSYGDVLDGLAAIFAGLLIGISRRQAVERTEQVASVQLERANVEVERARAEVLSERNHLARELHDVLAHTLAALSLQLEAFDTVVDAEPGTSPAVREQLARTRRLVHEGLNEARGAVQALRDDAPPIAEQLERLAAQHRATFTTTGTSRALSPQVTLGLYRATQEALTNVMKHATGARTQVSLAFGPDKVSVAIENAAGASQNTTLETSGGGYGLRGLEERLALVGGHLEVGPTSEGWRLAAEVALEPAPAHDEESVAP